MSKGEPLSGPLVGALVRVSKVLGRRNRNKVVASGALVRQLIAAWVRHNETLLYLVDNIPAEGLAAVPVGSRGRDVARQIAHLIRVRTGWLAYHKTGKRPRQGGAARRRPSRKELASGLKKSGSTVASYLGKCLQGKARPRLFGGDAVRWMAYLISHESQHLGQVLLALNQSRFRLPDRVAVQGLWGRWIFGR